MPKQKQGQSGPKQPTVHRVRRGDTVMALANQYDPGDPMAMITAMIYENDLRFDASGDPIVVLGDDIVIPDLSTLDPGTLGYYQQVGSDVAAGKAQYLIELMQIERDYQVHGERTTLWPGFGPNDINREITLTEAQMMDGLNLLQQNDVRVMADQSAIDANAAFSNDWADIGPMPGYARKAINDAFSSPADQLRARQLWPTNDGHNDAMRHALGSARLAQRFGRAWAQQFTTAHEGNSGGSSTREAMDLYNNKIGIEIAAANRNASRRDMAALVEQAVHDGRLVVLGSDGHLRWSNQVTYGRHGYTINLGVLPRIATPPGNAPVRPMR